MTPHLTALPSCKELSIPEMAVDKKTPHKGDRQNKRMSAHSRVDDFLKQQVSLKPQPTEYKQARLFMAGQINPQIVSPEKTNELEVQKVIDWEERRFEIAKEIMAAYNTVNEFSKWGIVEKANMAVDVLVSVKNEVLSAYNSIINMQI